jgi:hypothetical protein
VGKIMGKKLSAAFAEQLLLNLRDVFKHRCDGRRPLYPREQGE